MKRISVSTTKKEEFVDITSKIERIVKDSNVKIGDLINQVAQKSGQSLAVRSFVRFQIGE